jgi:hypothetical protein
MDPGISTLNRLMSVDLNASLARLAFIFNPTVLNKYGVLTEKELTLQKFLHLNELNTKHLFTITKNFVI